MKNTIKAIVTAAQFLTDNTPLFEGTPTPEIVTEVLSIADRLAYGMPDLKHVDYEYRDFSLKQDGSQMSHAITAEFNGRPMVCAIHGDLVMVIVKFSMELKKATDALECREIFTHSGEVVTDSWPLENRMTA